ncbi:MAG: ABC transporter ATP-binding protein [Lachnospiraceae bacterium]
MKANSNLQRLKKNIVFTYPYVKNYKLRIVVNILLDIIVTLLELLPPLLIMYLLDNIIVQKEWWDLPKFVLVFSSVLISSQVISFISNYIFVTFTEGVSVDARQDLFKIILKKKLNFFTSYSIGDLESRVMQDSGCMPSLYAYLLSKIISSLLKIIFVFGSLFYMNKILAILALISVPIFLILNSVLRGKLYDRIRLVRSLTAKMDNFYIDKFTKIKTIKNYSLENAVIKKGKIDNEEAKKIQISCENLGYFVDSIINIMTSINQLVVLIIGAYFVYKGSFTLGMLVAFNAYLSDIYAPFIQIIGTYNEFVTTEVSLERYREIKEDGNTEDIQNGLAIKERPNSVEFHDVTFGYNEDIILSHCNWKIEANDKILLKGKSGLGKSSVANILKGFYKSKGGEILYNGQDLFTYSLHDIRNKIMYLSQEQDFFDGTIRENFKIFKESISDEEIWNLLKITRLEDVIRNREEGLDLSLKQDGMVLSGGQRQRLLLTRIFIKEADIYILDEPFVGIDTTTTTEIWTEVKERLEDKIVILIDHNFIDQSFFEKEYCIKENKISLVKEL